ncbi:GTPase-activating Rap/Ran-GAP domain-like protein 3 [Ctenocephalides felis]|uniref:GTPase-activating Rap/Ran-GAP domain-like protein 3 n=1 Tax=Ctenocephalides felis TaxID=7515 RepID=UPI000E6E4BFF|nr:GTPase-activating Rap/Ran-GAP domain-like protein 3 [Ctenocephalides felis]
MFCWTSRLTTLFRGDRSEARDRSHSLCLSSTTIRQTGPRDVSTLKLLQRRASNVISSASELISRRGVFSRRHYGSVEQLPQTEVDGSDQQGRRYRIENGESIGEKDEMFGSPATPVLENPEYQTRWYFKYFLGKLHQNYVGSDSEKQPFFLSVVSSEANSQSLPVYRAILFKRSGTQKISLSSSPGQKMTVKHILNKFPGAERVEKTPKEIYTADVQKDLLLLEEQEGSVNFKFGIVYMRKGQSTDDEMLSNEHGSTEFDKFVRLLGDKVRLKGWDNYRGGLDVKGDMTGRHSVYTVYEGHEIMFHVSTLLPFSKDNRQQVERKRHIGNDIVNIVFLEDSDEDADGDSDGSLDEIEDLEKDEALHATFNPASIKSQFTHVFAVVSCRRGVYRLSVYCDESVPLFGPSLPCPPVFRDPNAFREFLLVKMINGEKAAFQTPTFARKRERTLDMLIKDLYAEHMNDSRMTMLNRRAFSEVLADAPRASRLKEDARQIEFVRVGQALKLDAIVKGDAPTSTLGVSCCGSGSTIFKRAPWEPECFYPEFPDVRIDCADSWGDYSLFLGTEDGLYVVEDGNAHILVFDRSLQVKQVSAVEAHGLLLVRAGTNGSGSSRVHVFRLDEFRGATSGSPPQVRTRLDVKDRRMDKTRGCHLYAISRPGGAYLKMAVAVGKRVLLFQWRHTAAWTAWCPASDTDTVEGFTFIKEISLCESPTLMTLLDGPVAMPKSPSAKSTTQNGSATIPCASGCMCVGYKNHFELVNESTGQTHKVHSVDTGNKVDMVAALDLYEDQEVELLLCYDHTCHFQKVIEDGGSTTEYDFYWNTVPSSIVCAFPYIIAFTSDSMEIRLLVNGNLVHTLSMPRLQLLASKSDVYFCSTAPEFRPATNPSCVERPSMNHNNHKNHNAAKIPMDNCSVTPNHSPPPHSSSYDNNSKPLRLYRIPVAHLSGTSAISEHGRRPPSAGNRRYSKFASSGDKSIAKITEEDRTNSTNQDFLVPPRREFSRSCSSSPTPASNKFNTSF